MLQQDIDLTIHDNMLALIHRNTEVACLIHCYPCNHVFICMPWHDITNYIEHNIIYTLDFLSDSDPNFLQFGSINSHFIFILFWMSRNRTGSAISILEKQCPKAVSNLPRWSSKFPCKTHRAITMFIGRNEIKFPPKEQGRTWPTFINCSPRG
jgi:hypothetical protein